jgi:hypothetical protein
MLLPPRTWAQLAAIEHDVNGAVFVDLTAELLEEMNLADDDKAKLLQVYTTMDSG